MNRSPSSSGFGGPRSPLVAKGAGLLLIWGLTGCHAAAGGTSGSPGTGGSDSMSGASNGGGVANDGAGAGTGGSTAVNCVGVGVSVAPTPLRRMTRAEYDNAARALLGTQLQLGQDFPPDLPAAGFASNRGEPVSLLGVEKLMSAAEALSAEAVTRLASIVPCAPAQGNAACAAQFYTVLARKAYRRTPSASELAELGSLYAWGESNGGFAFGVQVVIERILQSPDFFYHFERTNGAVQAGPSGNVAVLSGLSIADRLAAFIWHSLPDAALLDAAEHGGLDTPAGIAAQAERMLMDAKGRDGVVEFFNEWLEIQKLGTTEKTATVFPKYSPAVRSAMWTETATFVDFVVRQGDARLETLLTSNLALPSAPLAPLYGLPPGDSLTSMDPLVRSGLLTHPSVLAVHAHADQSSPVKRGAFLRDRVLCAPLPDPPPTVNTTLPAIDPNATTRKRLEQHRANPSCGACHNLIDPVGFAFEHYDGMGSYRSLEGTLPIDSTGNLTNTDVDGAFQNASDLSKRLAGSAQVRNCMATQWLRYAVRRKESAEDACSQQQVQAAFSKAGDVRELVLAIVQSDAFRFKSLKGTP